MTLDNLADIAEIVGSIAVLVTLVYLAIQVKRSSATARAQTRQALTDSQISYLNSRITDPFLRAASFKMHSGHELDANESYALRVHIMAHIRLFENYFTQHALGTMTDDEWRAMRELITSQFRLAPYRDAFRYREDWWSSDFAREVSQILVEIEGTPG